MSWQPSVLGSLPRAGARINGQVGAVGAYFGQDIQGIVDRLLGEQLSEFLAPGCWRRRRGTPGQKPR
jgi:hypothetical protein